jgi:hypothetical protein
MEQERHGNDRHAETRRAAGRQSNGVDFLARVGAGRAKLLLSRMLAASAAAPQKCWQSLTARTSVRWLGRSLALPSLHPSFHRIPENFNAIGRQSAGEGRGNAVQHLQNRACSSYSPQLRQLAGRHLANLWIPHAFLSGFWAVTVLAFRCDSCTPEPTLAPRFATGCFLPQS